MPAEIIKFERFITRADMLLKSFGLLLNIKSGNEQWNTQFMYFIFIWNMFNLSFVVTCESIYAVRAFFFEKTHFMEATFNLCCIGFAAVSFIKIYSLLGNKTKLLKLLQNLCAIFPTQAEEQISCKVFGFLRTYYFMSFGYIIIHLVLIWSFNLAPIFIYLIKRYILYDATLKLFLPYALWLPWNWHDNWTYYLLYVLLCIAGQSCMSGQLANDLLFFATSTQLIMHYRSLANKMLQFVAVAHSVKDIEKNRKFINRFIVSHQILLRLSEDINEVFGISILINFISAALVMCFLAFQITLGVEIHYLVMYSLFLLCSLIQALMISSYGQQLSDASTGIADAVYNHDWYASDLSYRKTMIIIIARAQKPACLKATWILKITVNTSAMLLQLSYKCFAMLRIMYAK